ncbi:hypothetical protein C8A01DRAFT_50796 [Parachaetomium inaequale]|uniref:Acetate kinase n=1 Tax=Parachaetomium inaequale TaxID=2588326 RepID=A0AAN6SM54_9PEZI|nr:hypothetical protein C8A01DRAFT_50796 [Parachaetomium inaequale]
MSSASSAPPRRGRHVGSADWTSTEISALTAQSSAPQTSQVPPSPDLGPAGHYHATITLFEHTPREETVYLGPWEIVDANPRRLLWQCSHAGEILEHFLPSDNPNELIPHTLHAQHRRFSDPREMEIYLSFQKPHRIRYTTFTSVGIVVHDEEIEVKYQFTTIEGSIQLQSDIRQRDLIDWFDVDVVWSDTHHRTDSYGNVRGLGTIQRIKLWRDRYSKLHYLTFYANYRRCWKEYLLDDFDRSPRQRDDRHHRLQLGARGAFQVERARAFESNQSHGQSRERRFSTSIFSRSSRHNNSPSALDIRYLGIQFSRNPNVPAGSDDHSRFIARWDAAHAADAELDSTHVESPSPHIKEIQRTEGAETWRPNYGLPTMVIPTLVTKTPGVSREASQP